jgi:hypothetical protein
VLNHWHTHGALEKGFPDYPELKAGSLLGDLHLTIDLRDPFSLETSWGSWMRGTRDFGIRDFPGRIVIQSHLLGFSVHPLSGEAVVPFLTAGVGIYVASQSNPVDRGGIAFAKYRDSQIGVHFGGGIRIPINKNVGVVVTQRYHRIKFSKEIDGSRNFSGCAGGIRIERGL